MGKCTLPRKSLFTTLFTTCHCKLFCKKHLHLVESLICYVFWKLCLNCCMTVCRGSGVEDTDDLYPGKKPGQEQNSEIHSPSGSVNSSFHFPCKNCLLTWQPVWQSEDKREQSVLGFLTSPCFHHHLNG